MSFQDFGKNRAGSRSAATSASTTGRPQNALSNISETLLQYQRNVGILEKIVQSMTASSQRRMLSDELSMQYSAQIDVLGQLEDKIRRQMKEQPAQATVQKLQRDFHRVEARVKELQEAVERWKEQKKKMAAASAAANTSAPAVTAADHERLQQLQLQEDRLQEEIMREREEEIRNINRGMHQVNEIYKDLAHIVGSQQEQIDTIENQMEESKVNAESGLKQVEQANERYGNGQCVIS